MIHATRPGYVEVTLDKARETVTVGLRSLARPGRMKESVIRSVDATPTKVGAIAGAMAEDFNEGGKDGVHDTSRAYRYATQLHAEVYLASEGGSVVRAIEQES